MTGSKREERRENGGSSNHVNANHQNQEESLTPPEVPATIGVTTGYAELEDTENDVPDVRDIGFTGSGSGNTGGFEVSGVMEPPAEIEPTGEAAGVEEVP